MCIAPYSKDYSLASNLEAKQHMSSRSSRVIPANNPPHCCKYSTGVSQYNKVWMQLRLPVEGRHPYLHYSGALVEILNLYSSKLLVDIFIFSRIKLPTRTETDVKKEMVRRHLVSCAPIGQSNPIGEQ